MSRAAGGLSESRPPNASNCEVQLDVKPIGALHWNGCFTSGAGGVTIAWIGRNLRIGQLEALKVGGDLSTLSREIIHEYLRLKTDTWGRIDGEFAVVLWDSNASTLHLVCDPVRSVPLYHSRTKEGVVHFGIHAGEVARAAAGEDRLNLEWIVSSICQLPANSGTTCFENVLSVPAGCVVTIDSNSHAVRRYWRPSPAHIRSESDLVEAFRARLIERVDAAVHGSSKVCVAVSGGLDSTGLLCIASRKAREKLVAVTHRIPDDPGSDELNYARLAAEAAQVDLVVDDGSDTYGLAQLSSIAAEPQHLYFCLLASATAKRAVALGCDCIMVGWFGDAVGGMDRGWPLQYVRSRNWGGLHRDLAKVTDESKLPATYRIAKLWLRNRLPALANLANKVGHDHQGRWEDACLIARETSSRHRAFQRSQARMNIWNDPELPLQFFFADNLTSTVSDTQGLARLIEQVAGVPVVQPFCDPELIRLSASASWELRHSAEGNRALERNALKGIIPEEIRTRRTKCFFDTHYDLRKH